MFTALPSQVVAYLATLALAAIASTALAAWIALKAPQVPGSRMLSLFLAGVAAWSAGQMLPPLLGPAADRAVDLLITLAPIPSAAFVHLVFTFASCGRRRLVASAAYAAATLAVAIGLAGDPGSILPWREFKGALIPTRTGWLLLATSAGLSIIGHVRLAQAWWQLRGQRRRQAAAMFIASFIGLASLTGFAFPALGFDAFPWPVLALPLYSLVLVYGILRYQFMEVNLWARRTVLWLLLVLVLGLASAGLAALPVALGGSLDGFWQVWLAMTATLALAMALLAPLRRFATRLVFPGAVVTAGDRAMWRESLAVPARWPDLERAAEHLLHARLGVPINVVRARGAAMHGEPALVMARAADRWRADLVGWQDAPPGPRFAAEQFADCLVEAAERLDRAEALVAQERDRQMQARMAELGELAATVAHDLRNPLNIIAMAAAGTPTEIRREISEQITRMNLLVSDVLDYARSWKVERRPLNLADAVAEACAALPGLAATAEMTGDLTIEGDARRLQQVLINLLENARSAGSKVGLFGDCGANGAVRLFICDNGPGVPEEIRDSLFRPFVSRREGGTGLGLAIAARIMEAHGGSVKLSERPGWSTCMELCFAKRTDA